MRKKDLINFFLSLKTKPFVILSGISGTGKNENYSVVCGEFRGNRREWKIYAYSGST